MLWGPNGISVGNGYLPTILPLNNDDVIIHYMALSGPSKLQKYTAIGNPVWAAPVDVLSNTPTTATTPANLFELSNQEIMVVFHKRVSAGVTSNLFAQKFDTNGIAQWSVPTQLASKGTAYNNVEYTGAQDGDVVYYGYSGATGTRQDAYLQRINPDGTIPWGINGIDFDTNQTLYETNTKIAFAQGSQFVWSVSTYTPSAQDLKGVYIQKFDKTTGARQFTDNAKRVFPVDNTYKTHAGNLQLIDDAPFFLITEGVNNGASPISIKAVLLNADGDFAWPEQSLPVATFSAPKLNITSTTPSNNETIVVFTEPKMSGQNRIYAQKFMFPTLSTNDFEMTNDSFQLYPNPTNALFTIKGNAEIKSISIYNTLGQLVYNNRMVNSFDLTLNSNNWSNGLYFISITTENGKPKNLKLIKSN